MTRLGPVQHRCLVALKRGDAGLYPLVSRMYGMWATPRQRASVRRALHTMHARGLVTCADWRWRPLWHNIQQVIPHKI